MRVEKYKDQKTDCVSLQFRNRLLLMKGINSTRSVTVDMTVLHFANMSIYVFDVTEWHVDEI